MDLGERRLHRSIDLGRCRWLVKRHEGTRSRKSARLRGRFKALKGKSQERTTLKDGWEAGWGGRRQGSSNSEDGRCRVRQARVSQTHSPGSAVGNQTPGEGPSVAQAIGKAAVRLIPWRGAKATGGRRRKFNDYCRRGRKRNTRRTTSRERRQGRTGSDEPTRRYATGQQHSEGHVNPTRGRHAAVTPRRHPERTRAL